MESKRVASAANSKAEGQVLANSGLLELILSNLRQREAVQLGRTCKAFQLAVQNLIAIEGFYPRCVVACSGNHGLVEVDLKRGRVLESNPSSAQSWTQKRRRLGRRERRHERDRPKGSSWLTGIAFSPEDHRLYVCQYKVMGVCVYSSKGCAAQEGQKFVSSKELTFPEGLAFAKGNLYVASADKGTICTVSLPPLNPVVIDKVSCGRNIVPWGMVAGPDDALYVAAADAYESEDYADPPPPDAKGNVLRIQLTALGIFGAVTNFCQASDSYSLKRPSGLCFDAAGRLYVTSMTGQILRFHGPASETSGVFDKLVIQFAEDCGNPWDVKCLQRQLIVTVHNGEKQSEDARIVVLDPETGDEVQCIRSKLLDQPNMLALE